jgi:hypothetical protein
MKAIEPLRPTVLSDEVGLAPGESHYNLNLMGVYQDSVTRGWAMQICRQATRWAGKASVQNTWYDASSLSNPGTFLEAVHAALMADVIVVSVYAAEELPHDLYVWFEAWVPRRLPRAGALAALIGVAGPPDSQSLRTIEYLQAVALKAQLDFVPRKRKRPIASPAASLKVIAEQAAIAPDLQKPRGQRGDAYGHWGLNE